MKKIILILITSLLLVGCQEEVCTSDNNAVCEIESVVDFEVEKDAKIVVGVFDKNYGEAIVEAINEEYPDVYSYEVIDPENLEEISKYDVIQTKVENVPLIYDVIDPVSENFNTLLENEYLKRFSNDVNQVENYFVPLEVKGLLFAYNKTMLESLGVNLEDANDDGLPESIDSFEKIGALASKWKENEATYLDDPLEKVFSFPFNDQLSMISFIENSNYKLIDGVSGEDLQVADSLLEALDHFKDLGKYPWHFEEESLQDMKWDYEEALTDQSAPFLLIGNWMFYEQYQQSQAYDLVFSRLPQINESDLSTLSNVSGFVIKKESLYPEAQNQFLKFVKDKEGVEISIEVGEIPIIDPLLIEDLDIDVNPNISEQIKAYTYSKSIDLQAFDKDPSIIAYNIYYDVDFRDVWRDLFFAKIDSQEAQKEMVERIKVWLEERDLEVEGITDELDTDNTEGKE